MGKLLEFKRPEPKPVVEVEVTEDISEVMEVPVTVTTVDLDNFGKALRESFTEAELRSIQRQLDKEGKELEKKDEGKIS